MKKQSKTYGKQLDFLFDPGNRFGALDVERLHAVRALHLLLFGVRLVSQMVPLAVQIDLAIANLRRVRVPIVDQLIAGLVYERHPRFVRLHFLFERFEFVLQHFDVLHVTRKLHSV